MKRVALKNYPKHSPFDVAMKTLITKLNTQAIVIYSCCVASE
jgi:hypothetical protein